MKKVIKSLTLLVPFILMSSFSEKNIDEFIGTYSVSPSDPSKIKLTINRDHTFYYQDFSIPDKKIMVNGNWTLKRNKVVLENNDSKIKFHNVWTFAEKGQVAKSHKGLTFYRLGKIDF